MSKKSKFIRIELNESDFQYKFILDNLWFYFLFLCLLIVFIYYFYEFSLGVICFSFLSGVFAFFSAFKAKFGKFECENSFALLFIIFAFGPAIYVGEFSRLNIYLNIFMGALMSITLLSFAFKFLKLVKS